MTVIRVLIALAALAGVGAVLASVLRTVVLPRAVPARLARLAFLGVRAVLLLRLRLSRRNDYKTRDHVFALQASFGLFAQLLTWGSLLYLCFAALFWAIEATALSTASVGRALERSGSSMLTLGFQEPRDFLGQFCAVTAAAVGLSLLALVITYLPSLYSAFSRREAVITKLVVRAGSPPSGPSLLRRSWHLGRFERMEEVWDAWEDWFIDLGETHTTFPQLGFFRSPHPHNHWVLSAEAVLDGAVLLITTCDVERQSRAELCLDAGVGALYSIARFLGVPDPEPDPEFEIVLPRAQFDEARRSLAELEVPLRSDPERSWQEFRELRARYEPLLTVLGTMTDSPRSDWSPWSEASPRHRPPLFRLEPR